MAKMALIDDSYFNRRARRFAAGMKNEKDF
jgi:hypothetical protein